MPVADEVEHQNQWIHNSKHLIPETASNDASSGKNYTDSEYVDFFENLPTIPHAPRIDQQIA